MQERHLEKREQCMAYKLNVTDHADELLDFASCFIKTVIN